MKFMLAVLFIRFIAALFEKNDAAQINVKDAANESDGLHPAEFEMRDQFSGRWGDDVQM
jgi:hypothetical protein